MVKVELPRNSGETKVEIPVSNVKPGTVAVLVHPDGTEEILKNSVPTEDGIQLTQRAYASAENVQSYKALIARGVKVTAQFVPADKPVSVADLI